MNAGLPGVGIGGMFYLASALLMPFRSLAVRLAGRDAHWTVAVRQALIALAALAAVWATGWAVGWVIAAFPVGRVLDPLSGAPVTLPVRNAVRAAALLGSVGTLTLVLAAVQVMRLLLPPRPTPRVEPMVLASEAQSAA